MNSSLSDRISASGRVVRVAPKYVYIHSDQYGSVFAYPAAYFNCLSDPPPSNNLTEVLRVDDVVHFTAVPQHGRNDCRWIAIKITKPKNATKDESSDQRTGLPETIQNIMGTIIELYDSNGFIYSEKFGKIYFPMAAAAESNELHPLNSLFAAGEWVLFDAQRQPVKNECRYVATKVQNLPIDYCIDESDQFTENPMEKTSTLSIDHPKVGNVGKQTADDQTSSATDLNFEEGDITRLFPQYGFIRSENLGTVFFTLAHFECEQFVSHLPSAIEIGDRVRFIPMNQPEKNGCRWRGLKVQKLAPDLITPLAQLVDDEFSMDDRQRILCEVSVQTDQSLWNAFLATQATTPSYRRREHRSETTEVSCQTRMPPEALLLKAVKEDEEFKAVLKERFPHLMLFVEKNT